jgi:hypothetical protein
MSVIALASLVVIPNLANPWPPVEERVLEIVRRRWNRSGNSPQSHFNDGAVVVIHPPVVEQPGLSSNYMVFYTIWRTGTIILLPYAYSRPPT